MNMNSGYSRYSMSNRAVEAYCNGEMPLSKWTKYEMLNAISDDKAALISRLTVSEMKNLLLLRSSWHHTSLFCNITEFYELDYDKIESINEETIDRIIKNRAPKKPRQKRIVEKPLFVTAYVNYSEWEGTREHPKKVGYTAIIKYMSNNKMVTIDLKKKRLSSLNIVYKIEQKTKFASAEQLKKKMQNINSKRSI